MNRLQQIYDFVCRHLLTQNRRAFGSDGKCKYLTDGLKCAAGCLFVGYSSDMEGKRFGDFSSAELSVALGVDELPLTEVYLIRDMQSIHDGLTEFDWPKGLVKLAEQYKLTPFTYDDLPGPRGRVNPFVNP